MSASIAWAHHISAVLPGLVLIAVVCLARLATEGGGDDE